jgi:hypothetical protein
LAKTPQTPDREADEIPPVHRDGKLDDAGVSQAVVDQFIHEQLPFLLKVKAEMDEGKVLTDGEMELMTRLVARAQKINTFTYLHPELKELVAKGIDLLHDITAAAVRNVQEKQ